MKQLSPTKRLERIGCDHILRLRVDSRGIRWTRRKPPLVCSRSTTLAHANYDNGTRKQQNATSVTERRRRTRRVCKKNYTKSVELVSTPNNVFNLAIECEADPIRHQILFSANFKINSLNKKVFVSAEMGLPLDAHRVASQLVDSIKECFAGEVEHAVFSSIAAALPNHDVFANR